MDELAIAPPESRPLRADSHLVVAEDAIHVTEWILEDNTGGDGGVILLDPLGEDNRAEDRPGERGGCAFEQHFDRQWHVGRGCDGWRVGDRWGIGDGWGQGDGRCERNGWGQRNGRCRR